MSSTAAPDVQEYLTRWSRRVDVELDRLLPPEDADPPSIHRAMRHSLFAGGKRLRPVLVMLGARAAGGKEEDVLGVACAVELIHTYSLIHDDLPAMDDDDLRRGRTSCHKEFGEAVAILTGDALNTHAFEVLARSVPDPVRVRSLVLELCRAAGTGGMVGGQVVDLECEGDEATIEKVRSIHERKTAALLAASVRMGALAVGAGQDLLDRLGGFGFRLGLAFQIVDDILDEEGSSGDLGKTPGKDRCRGKLTYPAAVGLEESRRAAEDQVGEALRCVEGLPGVDLLTGVARLVLERSG